MFFNWRDNLGSLAVDGAGDIVGLVAEIAEDPVWTKVVFSRDWHPRLIILYNNRLECLYMYVCVSTPFFLKCASVALQGGASVKATW